MSKDAKVGKKTEDIIGKKKNLSHLVVKNL
jgi:hypothetical protein